MDGAEDSIIWSDKPCKLTIKWLNNGGYSNTMYKGKLMLSHRATYLKNNPGYTFKPKDVIMHLCDVRNCIEITHLKLGTYKENIRDMVSKGRGIYNNKGSKNPNSTLVEEEILEIRRLYSNGGFLQRQLAKKFGISQQQVSMIVLNKHWKNPTEN